MQLFVILAATSAPDAAAWNDSLTAASAPASFVETVDLTQHSGFLPVAVAGKNTGFYFLLESYSELVANYPDLAEVVVKDPVVYSLGWGGDFYECAAVFFSASVLVAKFGGTAFDPQQGAFMTSSDLLDAAKQCQSLASQ